MEEPVIIRAETTDAEELTNIAFAAKRHWNYPENYFEIWKQELTITPKYISENSVFKLVLNNQVVGFYAFVNIPEELELEEIQIKAGWWMDHLFLSPQFHKQGLGRKMVDHAIQTLAGLGGNSCFIFVDPFASGFYEKIGAQFLYDSPSSIAGRTIPVYQLAL